MKLSSAIGGLAGACTLTLLNESIRKIDKDAPRLDLLGTNAVAKLAKGSIHPGDAKKASLAGDLITNSLYYGMADAGNKSKTLVRGTLLGLGAGLGALTLAKPLGLDARMAQTSAKTKALTVAWYLVSGLVAAAMINLLNKSGQH